MIPLPHFSLCSAPARRRVLAGLGLLAALAGCGGGGGGGGAGAGGSGAEPVVTAIRTESLKYGVPSVFVATGSNLDSSVTVKTDGVTCLNPAVGVLSATELRVVCTPDDTGALQINLFRQGVLIKTHSDEVVKPRVQMVIGTGGTPAQIEIAVDPGQKASVQRAWANSFLYYVNQGYYSGTIFHSLYQSAVVDGGCYSSTSLNKKQFLPSFALDAVAFSGPPNPAQNLQYTLSMNPDACTGNQYSTFALYVVKNNNRDTSKYVVIGSFSDKDAAAVDVLSNLERRGGPWLSESPSDKDLPKGTIKSLTQIR